MDGIMDLREEIEVFDDMTATLESCAAPSRPWIYSVKVVNKKRKSDWSVCKLRIPSQEFETLQKLKWQVGESLKDTVEIPIKTIGYVEHGHGLRGKQRWLTTDADLVDMYEHFSKKDIAEILLWCYSAQEGDNTTPGSAAPQGKKRQLPSDDPPQTTAKVKRTTRYECHQQKMDELEEIYEQLEEAQTDYTPEQLRAWAHLIQMNKHESYEEPPNKPFFRNTRKPKTKSKCDDLTLSNSKTLSPIKHVEIQSQLIDQISKLHDLLERGAISKEQYDKLQAKIMSEML